jgi:hypothetical protein
MSSLRTLQTGGQYALPPPAAGLTPTDVSTMEEWAEVLIKVDQPTVSKGLVSFKSWGLITGLDPRHATVGRRFDQSREAHYLVPF